MLGSSGLGHRAIGQFADAATPPFVTITPKVGAIGQFALGQQGVVNLDQSPQTIAASVIFATDAFGSHAIRHRLAAKALTDSDAFGAAAVRHGLAARTLFDRDLVGAAAASHHLIAKPLPDDDRLGAFAVAHRLIARLHSGSAQFGAAGVRHILVARVHTDFDLIGAAVATSTVHARVVYDPDAFSACRVEHRVIARIVLDPDDFPANDRTAINGLVVSYHEDGHDGARRHKAKDGDPPKIKRRKLRRVHDDGRVELLPWVKPKIPFILPAAEVVQADRPDLDLLLPLPVYPETDGIGAAIRNAQDESDIAAFLALPLDQPAIDPYTVHLLRQVQDEQDARDIEAILTVL